MEKIEDPIEMLFIQDQEIVNQVDRILCLIKRQSQQIDDISKRLAILEGSDE